MLCGHTGFRAQKCTGFEQKLEKRETFLGDLAFNMIATHWSEYVGLPRARERESDCRIVQQGWETAKKLGVGGNMVFAEI